MKKRSIKFACFLFMMILIPLHGQKKALKSFNTGDLKMHMDFLASDELEGRDTGEKGLEVAARYLAVQAGHLGLQPTRNNLDFFQYYTLEERSYDWENSSISIHDPMGNRVVDEESFFIFPTPQVEKLEIEGDIVFAGYGIKDDALDYNDFEGVDIRDKIVLIMDRAPLNADGSEILFDDKWYGRRGLTYKMQYMATQRPKAIMVVPDPKSGFNSITEQNPFITEYLSRTRSVKKEDQEPVVEISGPRIVLIHRSVADYLLEQTGKSLEVMQKAIDSTLEPNSFMVEGQKTKIDLTMKIREFNVPNIFGLIEGSDPELKDELVIYLAHFDHVGTDDMGGVFNGADDNASGTVALLEIAEAFMKEKKRPARSIGFLWVSGEEIGLFGSKYFADNPLVPIENIAAVINLDMVGRTATEEDLASGRKELTIVGRDSVKVIGAKQSSVLMDINKRSLKESGLFGNYTYNDENHPERFFYRSDHINFAQKDIPVLFYSTGTHTDYHQLTDVPERIDYAKFHRMTKFCFLVGYNTANYKGEITVDNPMSEW